MKEKSSSNTLPALGELELRLLQALWQLPGQDVKQLNDTLGLDFSGIKSVQSALERLTRKTLVVRQKTGRAYVYQAKLGRGELLGRLIGGVVRQVHDGRLEPILSGFVDFAERISDESLDELERLITLRKTSRSDALNSPTKGTEKHPEGTDDD